MKPERILDLLTLMFIGAVAYVIGLIIGGSAIQALYLGLLTIIACKLTDE